MSPVNRARTILRHTGSKRLAPRQKLLRQFATSGKTRDVGKLFNSEIDCTVSDRSPCPPEMKAGNIMQAWGGELPDCKTAWTSCLMKRCKTRYVVADNGKLMATNAADIFGLKHKRTYCPGKDADTVFIQPDSSYVLKNEDRQDITCKSVRMLAVLLARVLPKRFCAACYFMTSSMASCAAKRSGFIINISSNPVCDLMPVITTGILYYKGVDMFPVINRESVLSTAFSGFLYYL